MKATNILLIDDDQDEQLLFSRAVKEIDESINCWYASSGHEALQLVQELKDTPPDIIFLDLNMMPVTGKECLAELRKIDWLWPIPIIIYTVSNHNQEGRETEKLGATYFLTKRNSLTDIKNDIAVVLQTFIPEFATSTSKLQQQPGH